jgi:tetratricopeptide (TPR) repeat protein
LHYFDQSRKVTTELSVPVLSPPLQNRLQKILTEKISPSSINAKAFPMRYAAIEQAMKLYESSVEKRTQLPDRGHSAYCVFDLVKLAILEKAIGQDRNRERHLADATKLFTSTRIVPPEYMNDDYNFANLQSSKILYYLITRELVSYGITSESREMYIMESRLESDFPRRWAPTAMKGYADAKDRFNVLRVYKTYGADVFSPDAAKDRAVLERVKIAEALLEVGANQQAASFVAAWIKNLPDDQIGKAIQCEAIGELDLRQGNIENALVSYEDTLTILSSIGSINEYVAKSQREICSRILNSLKSTESARLKALHARAQNVSNAANHKMMQLECIALSKHLAETGSRLERMGQYETAGKLHAASAEIKLKNLGANDAETVRQQVDSARALMTAGKLEDAEVLLNAAIKTMRKSTEFDEGYVRAVLESHADILSRLNRDAEAQKLYAELRVMN